MRGRARTSAKPPPPASEHAPAPPAQPPASSVAAPTTQARYLREREASTPRHPNERAQGQPPRRQYLGWVMGWNGRDIGGGKGIERSDVGKARCGCSGEQPHVVSFHFILTFVLILLL
ncbi:hypothetical protein BD410DRAFT_847351 [Rickenella mellea]|uniref:Uncharacterized protein n=1 Tax=Rickenella mellea TaxID=50990 RepID=A0A4Y7PDK2_9AGAM|nr:hypothetical protein BD410DRAFT_847351 [Rickenella mellea]